MAIRGLDVCGWSSGKRAGPVRQFWELSEGTHSRAMGKAEITLG